MTDQPNPVELKKEISGHPTDLPGVMGEASEFLQRNNFVLGKEQTFNVNDVTMFVAAAIHAYRSTPVKGKVETGAHPTDHSRKADEIEKLRDCLGDLRNQLCMCQAPDNKPCHWCGVIDAALKENDIQPSLPEEGGQPRTIVVCSDCVNVSGEIRERQEVVICDLCHFSRQKYGTLTFFRDLTVK